jgi:PhoH-like ATPase
MTKTKRNKLQVSFSGRKRYVLDTSVLLFDYEAIDKFQDNYVDIPVFVLGELDKAKKFNDGVGFAARRVLHKLNEYGKKGSLKEGVRTKNGGFLRIVFLENHSTSDLPVGLERSIDSFIILTAFRIQKRESKKLVRNPVILVTNDVQMSVTANVCGVTVEDYRNEKISDLYSGIIDIRMKPGFDPAIIFEQNGNSDNSNYADVFSYLPDGLEIFANQGCIFRYSTNGNVDQKLHRILAIYDGNKKIFRFVKSPNQSMKEQGKVGIGPINDEQAIALDHLMNPEIDVVTLVGATGSGKTLLAILAAIRHMNIPADIKKQDEVVVYRPNYEMGNPMGFLPGDLDEKFAPWKLPIYDCLKVIKQRGKRNEDKLANNASLPISPINFLRGRTLHRHFVVVDEAQNLTPSEIRTIITRMGMDSKIILTGDPDQLDNPILSRENNGLVYLAQKLRGDPSCATVTFTKSERSDIARIALERLK